MRGLSCQSGVGHGDRWGGGKPSKSGGHGQGCRSVGCCEKWGRTLGHRAEKGRVMLGALWGPWDWHQPLLPLHPAKTCQTLVHTPAKAAAGRVVY